MGQSTEELATKNHVKPESIRVRLCRTGSYFGRVPRKLENGRLDWPNDEEDQQLRKPHRARGSRVKPRATLHSPSSVAAHCTSNNLLPASGKPRSFVASDAAALNAERIASKSDKEIRAHVPKLEAGCQTAVRQPSLTEVS